MLKEKQKGGITLISLVITIVVLLILASVAISIAIDSNGIFGRARYAADTWNKSIGSEETTINNSLEMLDEMNVGRTKKVQITKDNYRDYLGKIVTNFRPEGTGDTEEVTNSDGAYIVGTTYRLYYVDFGDEEHPNGKYGDGAGTIYLKADCTYNNNYKLSVTDTTDVNSTKMKELNPELYKTTPPDENQANMKAVKWLLNPANWNSLKETSPISSDLINYVVGAPSVEMMMDSYNEYYKEKIEDKLITDPITAGDRRTLFYQYTVGDIGYKVGPCADDGTEHDYYTSDNSVYTDSEIDEMYYPGAKCWYWLASPSGNHTISVIHVNSNRGGVVSRTDYYDRDALCPLVSLKSSVLLDFAE